MTAENCNIVEASVRKRMQNGGWSFSSSQTNARKASTERVHKHLRNEFGELTHELQGSISSQLEEFFQYPSNMILPR